MKVQLIKAKSDKRWYAETRKNAIGKTFKVAFSEEQSKNLERNVFEILSENLRVDLLMLKTLKL